MKKFELAWITDSYITEAERKATDEEIQIFKLRKPKKIVDFVDLITMKEYEIIFKHETDEQIQFYRNNGTIPVIVGDKITCENCRETFPRRSQKNICQICRGKKNENNKGMA